MTIRCRSPASHLRRTTFISTLLISVCILFSVKLFSYTKQSESSITGESDVARIDNGQGDGDLIEGHDRGHMADEVPRNHSAWVEKRKAFLTENSPRKVLLFSYMRGGSSTFGEIFNQDNRAAMWYEPGAAFYCAYFGLSEENFPQHDLYYSNMTRRELDAHERSWLVEYYTNMFRCEYESLPPETLGHWFVSKTAALKEYTQCMGPRIEMDLSLNKCIRLISPLCGETAQKSLQQNCHIIIDATKEVFLENPDLFKNMLQGVHDFFHFNANTYQMTDKLRIKLSTRGYFTPMVLTRLRWFVQHRLCMETVRIDNDKCLEKATSSCYKADVRVAQVNRMKMEDVVPLILVNPDIYVIHAIRDPRAIALSRITTDHLIWDLSDKRPVREAQIVCDKMAQDLQHRRRLEQTYPGVFLQVKYEDLVKNPVGVAADLYSHIGFPVSESSRWEEFSRSSMHAASDGGPYGNTLKDAVSNANRWTREIPQEQLDDIERFCGTLLSELGYSDEQTHFTD